MDRFRTQKAASILAYLAYHRHRIHPREALIEMIWPEAEIDSARHSLSLALSSLRHQLEPPGIPAGSVIVADRYAVELNPDAFTTDVMEFERALRLASQAADGPGAARHLEEAFKLYRGPLLPGFYDDWVLNERSRLGERFVEAVMLLAAAFSQAGKQAGALDILRRAIEVDPLCEDLHTELMRLLIAGGQPAAALAQYAELERSLARDLGVQPGAPLRRLAQQTCDMQVQATAPSLPATTVTQATPASSIWLCSDSEISRSMLPMISPRFSTTVTFTPRAAKMQAYSQPMTPPPMTSMVGGIAWRVRMLSES